ncbi:MAG: hypothetical protein R3F19_08570 [Verrucomicrobiales bacterium]
MDTLPSSTNSLRSPEFPLPAKACVFVILIAGVLAYGLSLNSRFYMDDYMHIVDNAFVKGEDGGSALKFRTFTYLVYRTVYSVAGPTPIAFHLVNLTIHLSAACALFACGKHLLRRMKLFRCENRREFAAFAGALIFVVHPFASEAVNYARCTMIGFVTLFTILNGWAALRWAERPNWRDGILFLLFLTLGAFSKEVGILHITFNATLIAWVVHDPAWLVSARSLLRKQNAGKITVAFVIALFPVCYLCYHWVPIAYSRLTSPVITDHWLTQGRMIWGYFINMVAPHGLIVDHQIAWSRSSSDLPAMAGTSAMIVVFLFASILVAKQSTRPIGVLVAMLIFPLALRLLYPIYEHFVEYRAYPALPWFSLIVGIGLAAAAHRYWKAVQWALTAITLAGIAMSVMRTAEWSSPGLLAQQSIDKYPLNNRPRLRLQVIAYDHGEFDRVLEIREDMYSTYARTFAYNESNRWARQYDMGRAYADLINCDQWAAYAMAEISGSKTALSFIGERLDFFRERLGPFKDEDQFEAAMKSLITARKVLVEHGAAVDRELGFVSAAGSPTEVPN